ncbi:flippase [Lactobacillus reuteri]|uniref:oligosaccharide flippase family protein n=1 Tax=Limosilactobacillus reuteri TaxID=1598 RepID=UPI00128DA884|nr:polysaccharide biosynthesis C-terminal domain-containing protein [Limosilactobacillus reuteri]MQB95435.1 flippase [Limosilactobacillus reuteri]
MKIIKNYFYSAGYQILVMIVPLLTTPYVNRVLGPYGIGIYTYTNTIIQYFILFGGLGLAIYGSRQIAYVRNNKDKMAITFWEIQLVRTISILIATVLFLVYLIIFAKYKYFMLLQFINLFAVAFDISWFFQGIENFKITFIRNTLIKICFTLLIFVLIRHHDQIGLYIFIYGISTFIGNITLWPELKRIINVKIKISWLKPWKHVMPTISLFVPEVAVQIYQTVNKTMLGAIVNTNSAGFYYDSDIIIKTILGLITALSSVMLPNVSNKFARGEMQSVKRMTYFSFNMATALIFALMFGISSIALNFAPLFFGKTFAIVGKAMILESPVIYFAGLSSILGAQYLIPTNQVKEYTISLTFGAVISIFLNVILIPMFHLYGAVLSTDFAEAAVLIYQIYIIKRTNQLEISILFKGTLKYLIIGAIMFSIVFYLNLHLGSSLIALIFEMIFGILIYALLNIILKTKISNVGIDFLKKLIK